MKSESEVFESLYVPMLHFDTINFDKSSKDMAICTLQASSCYIVAIVCKGNIVGDYYQFKGAYLAHLNTRQVNKTLPLKASFQQFTKEMETNLPDDYLAILCGGTREERELEKIINDEITEYGFKIINLRSVYSFPASKLFKKVNEDVLKEEFLDPSNLKKDGYIKSVSLAIMRNNNIKINPSSLTSFICRKDVSLRFT